jgi:hypothetical protein
MKITTLQVVAEMIKDVIPAIEKHGFVVTNIADKGSALGECVTIAMILGKKEDESSSSP